MVSMDQQKVELNTSNIKTHTSTVTGDKYTLQKVKPSAWLDILDDVENNKENKNRTLYTKVLENIVVSPKKTMDDFTNSAELDEVVKAAISFQRGK